MRALIPTLLCVLLAACLALGLRRVAVAQGAASVKPIDAGEPARSDR